jgi:hypothetical protein
VSGPVEVSGSTPLTQRLVEAATNAADKAEVEVYAGRRLARADLRYISEAVTAVLLREVAEELFEELLNRVGPGMVIRPNIIPELLRGWAESVERGE